MELYVLRSDNYNECAWENGACNLLGVYDSKELAFNELNKYIDFDIKENKIVDLDMEDWQQYISDNKRVNFYVDVYQNEEEKEDGKNMWTYVIEKTTLNKKGVFE